MKKPHQIYLKDILTKKFLPLNKHMVALAIIYKKLKDTPGGKTVKTRFCKNFDTVLLMLQAGV